MKMTRAITEKEAERVDAVKTARKIFTESVKDPKGWITDNILEVSEVGNYITILTAFGGPTELWQINTTRKAGKYWYHFGGNEQTIYFKEDIYYLVLNAIKAYKREARA